MAQIKIAEYTFDNSVSDVVLYFTPTTIVGVNEDVVNGNITTRTVYIDDSTMPTALSFGKSATYNDSLLTVEYLNIDSNITKLDMCFYRCRTLQRVNTSNWNTSNVTTFARFCDECDSLVEIDVSHFNVGKANGSFYMMFHNVQAEVLDVSKWNVNTTDGSLATMFENCSNVKNLDLSNWKVKIVHTTGTDTCVRNMFSGCSSLEYLDLSGFDFSEMGASMINMFRYCSSLREIKGIENLNVSKVKDFSFMFQKCSSLTSLNLSNWSTDNATTFQGMFHSCTSLTEIKGIENFNVSKSTTFGSMFYNCLSLTSLDLRNWVTSSATSFQDMFADCRNLEVIRVDNFDTSKVKGTGLNEMFSYCQKVKTLNLNSFTNSGGLGNFLHLCSNCVSLEYVSAQNFVWGKCNAIQGAFTNCKSLKMLDLTNFDGATITTTTASLRLSGFNTLTCPIYYNSNKCTQYDTGITSLSNAIDVKGRLIAIYTFDNTVSDLLPITGGYAVDTVTDNITHRVLSSESIETTISFIGQTNLKTVEYMCIPNTRTSLSTCFNGCTGLTAIDVSNWDVSKVTTINNMFRNCSSLQTLNVSNWDVSSVTDMASTFYGCSNLQNLDVSNWDTSSVTTMNGTFAGCSKLTVLDVSNFDTSNVGNMAHMFNSCQFTTLDLSNFDTSKVTNKGNMFASWTSTQKVYISSKWTLGTDFPPTFILTFTNIIAKYKFNQNTYESFIPTFNTDFTDYAYSDEIDTDGYTIRRLGNDSGNLPTSIKFNASSRSSLLSVLKCNTSNITDMSNMFVGCTNLQTIDVSDWDTSSVTNMSYMFNACSNLQTLDVRNWNTSSVTNMGSMFNSCVKLTTLDTSNWKTSSVTNMTYMFKSCHNLTTLDVSNFDTSKVVNMTYMFNDCINLTILDVSKWDTSKVTNMNSMFYNCSKLQNLDVSDWKTSLVTNMSNMFYNCSSLQVLDVSKWNTSLVTDMNNMFNGCGVTSINTKGWDTSKVTDINSMFRNMKNITTLDLSHFDTGKVSNCTYLAAACSNLKNIDLSSFVRNSGNGNYLLADNPLLETVDMSNWETPKSSDFYFRNSSKLKTIGMLYCSAESINNLLSKGFQDTTLRKGITIYYHDADPSQLTPVEGVTFKKYAMPTTIQLPPHIQLHSLPDGTRDEVDIKTGILTRRVGHIILDDSYVYSETIYNTTKENTIIMQWYDGVNFTIPNIKNSSVILCDRLPNREAWGTDVEAIDCHSTNSALHFNISKDKLKGYESTFNGAKEYLRDNPLSVYYQLETPTTEQLILNYNNSCDYGRILPTGMCDKYDVIESMYTQTMTSILLDGENTWDAMEEFENTVKFTATGATVGVENLNMLGAGGLYCDNDLFPNINDDSDVEHCRVDEAGNKFYIYVDKERLMSPDLIGWQIWLQENKFNMIYELAEHLTYVKPYEELDPTQARWEGMDCRRDGAIRYHTYSSDKITLYPTLEYVAPSINNFEVPMLEPNTEYTIYAKGINDNDTIKLGGADIEFANGGVFTSGESQWLRIDDNDSFYNMVITKGDTTGEVVPYFKGMASVKTPVLMITNNSIIDGMTMNQFIDSSNGNIYNTNGYARSDFISVSPNEKFFISFNERDFNNSYINIVEYNNDSFLRTKKQIKSNEFYTSSSDCTRIRVSTSRLTTNALSSDMLNSFQLNMSTKANILTFNEPVELRSLSNEVKDTINVVTGEYVQRVGEVVLNGSEGWWESGNTNETMLSVGVDMSLFSPKSPILCNNMPNMTDMTSGDYGLIHDVAKTLRVNVPKTIAQNVEEFKQWLNSKNLIICGKLEQPIITQLDPQTLLAYENGTINLSSDTGVLPTVHYTVPSTNTFYLPSMKTGTRYTLKYPSASGSIIIGDISYNISSDSMLFTTPLKINGDTSAIIFSDNNPENVMLLEGAYNKREVPFFTGVKSVKNPNITIIDQLSTESTTYNCETEIELRGLPNGVADKLDIIKGKLTTNVGVRPYQEGDENLPNIWTDGYETVYALSSPVVTNVTIDHPTVTTNSLIELSSDYLIPQLNYRAPSSNNFPLDLLQPNTTYTLYADTLVSGSYTLGGTKTGVYSQPHTITLADMTDNLLTFNGDLGLSNVMLVKGNSLKTTLPPYFSGIRSVTDGHLLVEGMAGEINEITFDEGIVLRDCNGVKDVIDLNTCILTKRTGEITLTGIEGWSASGDKVTNIHEDYVVFLLTLSGIEASKNKLLVNDRLPNTCLYGLSHDREAIYAISNQLRICVKKSRIGGDTVSSLKAWLVQNPTTVIYPLTTPIEVPLENVWTTLPPTSYDNQTEISSTVSSTSLKPMISVTIATTTLEEIVSQLEQQNAELQAQNESLEQENVATMLALTDLYETMVAPMAVMSLNSDPYAMSTMSLDDEEPATNVVGYTVSPMGMVYAKLVHRGLKTMDEVPYNLQVEVMYALKGME